MHPIVIVKRLLLISVPFRDYGVIFRYRLSVFVLCTNVKMLGWTGVCVCACVSMCVARVRVCVFLLSVSARACDNILGKPWVTSAKGACLAAAGCVYRSRGKESKAEGLEVTAVGLGSGR